MTDDLLLRLLHRDIRPTANRIVVLRLLRAATAPVSLGDIEERADTLDKSSISRVLNLFAARRLVHVMEDGDGIRRYELCTGDLQCPASDLHPHFYCEVCHRTRCLKEVTLPHPQLPEGYTLHWASYLIRGICPQCRTRTQKAAR